MIRVSGIFPDRQAEKVNKFSNLWHCSAVLAGFVSSDFFSLKTLPASKYFVVTSHRKAQFFLRENFPESLLNEFWKK